MEHQEIKQNVCNCKQWSRLLYMLLFFFVLYITMSVLWLVVVIQILFSLVTSNANENILKFSSDLAKYINQIILFLTYSSNTKPYPFTPWEQGDMEEKTVDEHETIIDDVADDDSK